MIDAQTRLVIHAGFPVGPTKAPSVFNAVLAEAGVNVAVIPMDIPPHAFERFLGVVSQTANILGVSVTMPHKPAAFGLVLMTGAAARVAEVCNLIRRNPDGTLYGDTLDGAGFVRSAAAKGVAFAGRRAILSGCGGVGSPIAAALAEAGVAELTVYDIDPVSSARLATRLDEVFGGCRAAAGSNAPAGYDIVVNATPLGMFARDALPFDPARIEPGAFVGDVVTSIDETPLLKAALAKGCRVQIGRDMLIEQIPLGCTLYGIDLEIDAQRVRYALSARS